MIGGGDVQRARSAQRDATGRRAQLAELRQGAMSRHESAPPMRGQ
jgi:hypothetical protein